MIQTITENSYKDHNKVICLNNFLLKLTIRDDTHLISACGLSRKENYSSNSMVF